MGGRDPITTSQTLHNTWENVNKINRRVNKEIFEYIKLSLNFEQHALGLYFILILRLYILNHFLFILNRVGSFMVLKCMCTLLGDDKGTKPGSIKITQA